MNRVVIKSKSGGFTVWDKDENWARYISDAVSFDLTKNQIKDLEELEEIEKKKRPPVQLKLFE